MCMCGVDASIEQNECGVRRAGDCTCVADLPSIDQVLRLRNESEQRV